MKRLLAVAVTCCWAISSAAQDKPSPPLPPKVLQAEGGRFVFGQVNDWRADQFLLDTKTGRLWQIVMSQATPDKPSVKVLQPVPFTVWTDERWTTDPR